MSKSEALQQWSDELRQDGLYVSSVIKAAFSDGWERATVKWTHVDDAMPKNGSRVLICQTLAAAVGHAITVGPSFAGVLEGEFVDIWTAQPIEFVSHWMIQPEAPEARCTPAAEA